MTTEHKPHSGQDDFAVLRTYGFCGNMADRENFGDRQCWERRWHRKNWCVSCTERTEAIARIEEQLETARRERDEWALKCQALVEAVEAFQAAAYPASEPSTYIDIYKDGELRGHHGYVKEANQDDAPAMSPHEEAS